ncbi:hypothetical protein ACN4EG_01005 [Alkalinema pantanalense CENA528]
MQTLICQDGAFQPVPLSSRSGLILLLKQRSLLLETRSRTTKELRH